MKIISYTLAGDEQEIIESFIRYNYNFVDEMVIVLCCSIDNTGKIIRNLIQEGYRIKLFEETEIAYEQRRMDNRYIRWILDNRAADWIIPLDADEFITGDENPRKVIEGLPADRVYYLNWKFYAMTPEDDESEKFIPKRLRHFNQHCAWNDWQKVILPATIMKSNDLSLATGHHDVVGEVKKEALDVLRMAHFPCTSVNQYILKTYSNSIKYTTWSSKAFGEGGHVFRQIAQLDSGYDIYGTANSYGQDVIERDGLSHSYMEDALRLDFCDEGTVVMRYGNLSEINVVRGLRDVGRLMGIRAYKLEKQRTSHPSKTALAVFGVGREAEKISRISDGECDILCYMDNDAVKQFQYFCGSMVIPPDYAKFFEFDCIVIAAMKHETEIKKQLTEMGYDPKIILSAGNFYERIRGKINERI